MWAAYLPINSLPDTNVGIETKTKFPQAAATTAMMQMWFMIQNSYCTASIKHSRFRLKVFLGAIFIEE